MPHMTTGIAGHIDHGKTALTKALTNIDTDRLKEEKDRRISIENGFAYIKGANQETLSVIDVPGHEGFIRQMIAGVAGIDLLLICVAADEGVMPQTLEHVIIADLLEIEQALIVVTKADLVEPDMLELVRDDIRMSFEKTRFKASPLFFVDSLSGQGIPQLKEALFEIAKEEKRKSPRGSLRLPIDDVFSLHGHGTIVRGTIFNGRVQQEATYKVLPLDQTIRIKGMQVHHEEVDQAEAGQRVALNIAGLNHQELKRGDVIVSKDAFQSTTRMDVACHLLEGLRAPIKQRMPVIIHQGTTVAKGRLIFFDRNKVEDEGVYYCQLELEDPLIVQKGDRFILRRPSPVETLGGGRVIAVHADKHRYGEETVDRLKTLAKGTPMDWVLDAFENQPVLNLKELQDITGLDRTGIKPFLQKGISDDVFVLLSGDTYTSSDFLNRIGNRIISQASAFHQSHPLKRGMTIAAVRQDASAPRNLIDAVIKTLEQAGRLITDGPYIRLSEFVPHFPSAWEKRMQSLVEELKSQGLQSEPFGDLVNQVAIPKDLSTDLFHFLVDGGQAIKVEDDRLVHHTIFQQKQALLKKELPTGFSIQEAKSVLDESRKPLVPFLETLDRLNLTKREGNRREWV